MEEVVVGEEAAGEEGVVVGEGGGGLGRREFENGFVGEAGFKG